MNLTLKSILAGMLISIAGWAYLSCESKVVGSFVFSIGLIAVILLKANLYTGKVGYISSKKELLEGIVILAVNLITAYLIGLVYRACCGPSEPMASRLSKEWYRILVDGIGCGVCIYIAVEGYKQSKSLIPVIIGVMAFILAGFEHCIADAFYFGASQFQWKSLGYVMLAALGNSIGSLSCHWLQKGISE